MTDFNQSGGFQPFRGKRSLRIDNYLKNGTRRACAEGMKLTKLALFVAFIALLIVSPAFAQRGGGGGHAGGGGGHAVAGGGYHGGYGGGYGGGYYRGGFYGRGGYWGGGWGWGWGSGFYFGLGGWGYPYYYGYPYYPYYYSPSYYSYDPYAYGGSYQSSYPAPQSYSYPGPPPQQSRTQAQAPAGNNNGYYLIAFKDHNIQAATAYKVDGDQFHWITREGQELQAPLSSVDIQFSQQINRDRNVELPIP